MEEPLSDTFRPYVDFIKKKLKTEEEKDDLERKFEEASKKLPDEDALLGLIVYLEEKFPEYPFETFSEEAAKAASASASASASAAASAASADAQDGLLPVIAKENPGGGDCFYHSLYGAAAESDLLPKMRDCLRIRIDSRSNFIQSFRDLVGERIKGGLPTEEGKDYFLDVLVPQIKSGNWSAILLSYPSWFRAKFIRGVPRKEKFFQIVSEEVKKMGNWVGEIEVTLIEHILNDCDIKINKYNHNVARGIPGELNLWNKGEAHWVHFSFDIPPGYTESKAYKKLLEEEIERADRLEAEKLQSEQKHYANYQEWKKNPASRPQFEKRNGYEYNGEVYIKPAAGAAAAAAAPGGLGGGGRVFNSTHPGARRKTKKIKKSTLSKKRFRRTRSTK